MGKILPAIAISLVVGFAAASWINSADTKPEAPANTTKMTSSFDAGLPVEDRIAALERAVSDERFARQLLQEEVFYLTVELEQMAGASELDLPDEISAEQAVDEPGDSRSSRREEYRRRNSVEGQIERLIEAGFLPSQASMIVRRESELQMESLRARYEAERNGDPVDYWRSRNASSDALRQELGDADYERYLAANNRSTSVTISSVIDSSPAQSAGLQPGDEIVRYDGERVFSMTDLTRQTMDGIAGQNVVVDIMRGGTSMQIVIPRGPVGITGGRRRR
ncbi:MAG: PDZ domain-containing protein [Proteobacteria bacterium]|nr:PDZ domain-containing protein [Pseudomonadota bacterium]